MLAAVATNTSSVSLTNLPVGWFDGVLVVVLIAGFLRGRKHGMTKEVLPMFQWLAIVLLGGLAYEMAGQLFMNLANLKITAAYILGYLSLAFLVYLAFVLLNKVLTPRLAGSNFFGSMEYYLGITSGVLRFGLVLLFALALLHAPYYTQAEIAAHNAYNARWYGGGQKGFSGNFFPTLQTIQVGVFTDSLTGPLIAKYLGVLLINTEGVKNVRTAAPKPVIHIGN